MLLGRALTLGTTDGPAEGRDIGAAEGRRLGEPLGATLTLGAAEGRRLGVPLGRALTLGALEGAREGWALGGTVLVGGTLRVGAALGRRLTLGTFDGAGLGAADGNGTSFVSTVMFVAVSTAALAAMAAAWATGVSAKEPVTLLTIGFRLLSEGLAASCSATCSLRAAKKGLVAELADILVSCRYFRDVDPSQTTPSWLAASTIVTFVTWTVTAFVVTFTLVWLPVATFMIPSISPKAFVKISVESVNAATTASLVTSFLLMVSGMTCSSSFTFTLSSTPSTKTISSWVVTIKPNS